LSVVIARVTGSSGPLARRRARRKGRSRRATTDRWRLR
jgi:hypothetical protein